MAEPSEDSESKIPVTAEDGQGQAGSDQPDRPKLVALPGPTAEPAPAADDAEPASTGADADRLALERTLSGPPGPGPALASGNAAARAPDPTRAVDPARAPDSAVPVPSYAPWAPSPYGVADAIALSATPGLVQALRAEIVMRAHAEAGLRARTVDAETRLAARVLLSQRTTETLRQVRAELDQLAGLLTDERARRRAAEQRVAELEQQLATDRGRSEDAAGEIVALRTSLQQLRAPAERHHTTVPGSPVDASSNAVAEVRADRLSDALTRLRADTEPIDPLPASGGPVAPAAVTSAPPRATLARPFRTLCRRDPALAGQLALALLPLQGIADPRPVSYDVVLGLGSGCVQVTSSGDAGTEVARQATARPPQEVDFQVVGGPERFAKLLAAGRVRRRLGFWVVARVRGNRARLAALDALLALPLDLPAPVDGGTSMDPAILAQLQAWIKRAQSE